ncbi:uncharacterized protein DFL_000151 [Arthrobotrys flagrans]|uniref:Glutathione S-transferase n=1 Tax=Arthrobotrys flagrans TaxID=97331 RepID=A0A437AEI6_ARTFL|nr:hypothetical protein DFL_000151 [Arthrobotrys flagrans]
MKVGDCGYIKDLKSNISNTVSTEMSKTPELTLYTGQTPNGIKISIALSLLSLPYTHRPISLPTHEQKSPWFISINPNGRIPALTDHRPPSSLDEPLHIMESGAILLYLVDTYDDENKIGFEKGTREYWEMVQWVFWQNAGLGPMQGQANHFVRYAGEDIRYGKDRYVNETRRLYSVLETRLESQEGKGSRWVVGDRISIADITIFGWAVFAEWAGVGLEGFERVRAWRERMEGVEGVKRGRDVEGAKGLRGVIGDREKEREVEEESRRWILEGMKRDAERK